MREPDKMKYAEVFASLSEEQRNSVSAITSVVERVKKMKAYILFYGTSLSIILGTGAAILWFHNYGNMSGSLDNEYAWAILFPLIICREMAKTIFAGLVVGIISFILVYIILQCTLFPKHCKETAQDLKTLLAENSEIHRQSIKWLSDHDPDTYEIITQHLAGALV